MYVRDAKNREEVWLLDHIESMELDDTAFRSRDYVIAVDEESGEKAGFGRIRIHKDGGSGGEASDSGDAGEGSENGDDSADQQTDVCELTSIGVLDNWRGQGVGAHIIERLIEYASDEGFDTVYSLTSEGEYLAQFGFRRIEESKLPPALQHRLEAKRDQTDPDAVAHALEIDRFRMPDRLREAFKQASDRDAGVADEDSPEDFGIDTESATYKYDTGR
ncbi:GNAT family acetyltransferase [Natrialba magadii ATCC 43099]|uniref:GNAT family acetyltransferase n=1 Tax=Natrialba magadii (strain ATCC 43099 / DSM 3394 / CCM 3739 / CIP 104546 / IAM 13178 / JCM 8861 / NBRC 102185 / NCIMB 2190 / MS3) TaxID=547559 RepID=D3SYN6_NATMM|nr:GNAT family N-acetyltransferase [Natrialba magadii]ADD04147.1 GNAT family acetyltransferase [Natrialba magadii ATCC 43099]ELY32932.1 N-acetyltransferase GCN5 [Natrialba magadii ATCC 43099]